MAEERHLDKTDRRDARKLARLSRSGELTAAWVPDEEHEAMRDLVRAASEWVAEVTGQLERALCGWSLAPVVRSLVALRGVDRITAATLLAELGDISRFDSPRQLMAFLAATPAMDPGCDRES